MALKMYFLVSLGFWPTFRQRNGSLGSLSPAISYFQQPAQVSESVNSCICSLCHLHGNFILKNSHNQKQTYDQHYFFLIQIAEAVGGYFSNSLAVMTDAAHMLSDFTSFLISLFAIWISSRAPSRKMSFGYYRAGIVIP